MNRSGGRTISELDSNNVTLKASRPASLPTPPTSSITSKKPIKTASAIPPASTTESQDIAHLHAFLQDRQSKIDSLNLKLKDTQNELQCLRNQRQEASNEYLRAICGDVEEEIEKYKRREKRLVRMVKEKKQTIERLEKEIDEGRERERELRGILAEAEAKRRAKEGEDRLREADRRAKEGEDRLREAEKGVDGGGHAEVEDKGKEKSKGKGEKRGGARAGRTNWEFRRKKGEKETSSGAMYQVLSQRGMP